MAILFFFVAHYYLSLFTQTFYLHRYAAHKMFTMNKFWEKFFFLFTYICQGSSFLSPRAYALLHRMHHADLDIDVFHYFRSAGLEDPDCFAHGVVS